MNESKQIYLRYLRCKPGSRVFGVRMGFSDSRKIVVDLQPESRDRWLLVFFVRPI